MLDRLQAPENTLGWEQLEAQILKSPEKFDYNLKKEACIESLSELKAEDDMHSIDDNLSATLCEGRSLVITSSEPALTLSAAKKKAMALVNSATLALTDGNVTSFVEEASKAIAVMMPHKQ
mmetsp:Transcript_9734/g.15705  ORF Transcript_9734/g.15705 Transcript_9734/m.15705 type:complete len:121 (+) Transcript_9734:98-460(+)